MHHLEGHHGDHHQAGQQSAPFGGVSAECGGHMDMMKMYFHFGLGDLFLIRNFVLDSPFRLLLVCFGVFLAAILVEAIDYTRGYLSCRCIRRESSSSKKRSRAQLINTDSAGSATCEDKSRVCARGQTPEEECCEMFEDKFLPNILGPAGPVTARIRLAQAGLQFVRTGLSLVLMLVAMTYNVCLIFPIMLGSSFGFYVFYRTGSDVTGVCH